MKKKEEQSFTLKTADTLTDRDIVSEPEKCSQQLLDALESTDWELQALYEDMISTDAPENMEEEIQVKLRSSKRTAGNIRKAYQHCVGMSDELNARWSDLTKGRKRKIIPAAPANSLIDMEEKKAEHFAKGIGIYKLMLICFIGSFAGVVIETLWCLVTRGYIESRAGLVYGPFNILYGAGAVVLSLTLYKFRNKGKWISFLGGFIVGSAVEYICSWGQELVLGSRSWDYSHMPFNINGRICLLYSIFWGILGVFWIKVVYPWMAKLILKIPNRVGKTITWTVTVFLIINIAVSMTALFRWSQRQEMIAPSNPFWEFVDERFPDERMEQIYANMEFGSK